MSVDIPEFADIDALEDHLSTPDVQLIEEISHVSGDIIVLGAGGKMGPTLAVMARKALDLTDSDARVLAVARFSDPSVRERLEVCGVKTLSCDLLDVDAVQNLPDAPNVLFMAGMKFGASGNPALTWAMNALVPAIVAERYSDSRIVVFSSGNIYPFSDIDSGGATEQTLPAPLGEYAQSVLARERIFEYFAHRDRTNILQYRLNYAVEPRYGVPVDIALKLMNDDPIDLSMGYVNLIWQRDANEIALRCLTKTANPPAILNVTGATTHSVRALAETLGDCLGREPVFMGREKPVALLSNATLCREWFGEPPTPSDAMLEAIADWIGKDGVTLGKPTKFQVRDGSF
jgi:dTDP-4-dehydrorhamnose reductase